MQIPRGLWTRIVREAGIVSCGRSIEENVKKKRARLPFVCVFARDSASTTAKKHLPEDFLTGMPFRVRNNPNDSRPGFAVKKEQEATNIARRYEFLATFVLVFVCRTFSRRRWSSDSASLQKPTGNQVELGKFERLPRILAHSILFSSFSKPGES